MKGSLAILFFFVVGVFTGINPVFIGELPKELSYYTLCALMVCVGLSMGHSPHILRGFKTLSPRLLLLPLLTIVGTLVGCLVASLILSHRSISECMAIGSGFAYYSLSSIFITEYKGIELGTIALLSNIIRELITLLVAPLLVRWFGKLAPISAGGATTMDTTLPIVMHASGKEFMVLSIYHGFVVDFSVPFLVTLFCSL